VHLAGIYILVYSPYFFRQTHICESGFPLSGRSRSNGEDKVVPVHGMRAYRQVEVELHPLLTSTGGGGGPGHFKSVNSHRCGLSERLSEPQSQSGRFVEEIYILPLPGF
jgi:hypothetical protein